MTRRAQRRVIANDDGVGPSDAEWEKALVGTDLRQKIVHVIEGLIELIDDVEGDPEQESDGDDLDDQAVI